MTTLEVCIVLIDRPTVSRCWSCLETFFKAVINVPRAKIMFLNNVTQFLCGNERCVLRWCVWWEASIAGAIVVCGDDDSDGMPALIKKFCGPFATRCLMNFHSMNSCWTDLPAVIDVLINVPNGYSSCVVHSWFFPCPLLILSLSLAHQFSPLKRWHNVAFRARKPLFRLVCSIPDVKNCSLHRNFTLFDPFVDGGDDDNEHRAMQRNFGDRRLIMYHVSLCTDRP